MSAAACEGCVGTSEEQTTLTIDALCAPRRFTLFVWKLTGTVLLGALVALLPFSFNAAWAAADEASVVEALEEAFDDAGPIVGQALPGTTSPWPVYGTETDPAGQMCDQALFWCRFGCYYAGPYYAHCVAGCFAAYAACKARNFIWDWLFG